jgi:hypothetical protein
MKRDYVTPRFMALLERRQLPQHLRDNPQAAKDEADALCRAAVKVAPDANVQEWWPRFEDTLDRMSKGRWWPIVSEIFDAAKKVPSTARVDTDWTADPRRINAKRIKAGEPVGDCWLFGRSCLEMMDREGITENELEPYRESLRRELFDLYDKDEAAHFWAGYLNRHEAAKEAV